MRYKYVITRRAAKEIKKLNPVIRIRLKKKLEYYIAQENPLLGSKTLTNNRYGNYRWRVGDYRIIFDVDNDNLIILQVQHRRDIYRHSNTK